jgi:hypothetical protein
MKAVEVIMEHGVPEDRIIFINLVGAVFHLLRYLTWGERRSPHPRV